MAKEKLVLYTHPQSRGRVARWILEEAGVDYRTEYVEYGPAGMKSPAYLGINPMGKVPALRRGDMIVTENAAICAWVADAFPAAGLAPAVDDPDRGAYFRWMFFVAGPLETAMFAKATGATMDAAAAGFGRIDDVVDTLHAWLADRSYVASNRFTAADVMMASYLGWYMQTGLLEQRPVFEAYVARHRSRDAAVRVNSMEDAELARRSTGTGAG